MFPSSSISASEARHFLIATALSAAVLLAAALAVILAGVTIRRGGFEFQALIAYQLGKIEAMRHQDRVPDTLFLGDSSLGNAIDAARWSELAGRPAANLALTSLFAFAGDLNLLRRVLAVGRPRNVVIMHIADAALARESPEANLMTEDPAALSLLERARLWWRLSVNLKQLSVSFVTLRKWLRWQFGGPNPFNQEQSAIAGDYVAQGRQYFTAGALPRPRDPARVAPDRFLYLERLGALCRATGVNCVFLFGPLADPDCSASSAFFDQVAARIAAAGISVAAPRPRCLAAAEVGDTENHVRPELRRRFTDEYFAMLASHLK